LNGSYCHAAVLRAMPTGIAHSMLAHGQQPIAIRSKNLSQPSDPVALWGKFFLK